MPARGLLADPALMRFHAASRHAYGDRLEPTIVFGSRARGDAGDLRAAYGSASWIAPEPFRGIGFRIISAMERRTAGLEA